MESKALTDALSKRLDALELAVLALIEHHTGTAGFSNSKAYQLSSAIRDTRDEWDSQTSSDD
jgi:succinylglutamate desuccinylase